MSHVPPPPMANNSPDDDAGTPAHTPAPPPPGPGTPPLAQPPGAATAPAPNLHGVGPAPDPLAGSYPSAGPGPRFEPVPRVTQPPPPTGRGFDPPAPTAGMSPAGFGSPPLSASVGPVGFEPPPPTGAPLFVSAHSERRTVVTSTYDHVRSRWGLGDMFVSLCVFFSAAIGLFLLVAALGGASSDGIPEGPWLLIAVVGPHVALLTHLVWVINRKGISFAEDFKLRVTWPDIGLSFGLFVGALVSAGLIAVTITAITGDQPTAAATDLAQDSGDGGLTIWLYLFAFLGATFVPVVEELVYRGLFWSALEKRGMKPWMILVITSAVFAIIHLEPIRTAVLFAVGLAIGFGRLLTGRIGASIAVHIFINSLAMTATLIEIA